MRCTIDAAHSRRCTSEGVAHNQEGVSHSLAMMLDIGATQGAIHGAGVRKWPCSFPQSFRTGTGKMGPISGPHCVTNSLSHLGRPSLQVFVAANRSYSL